MGAPAPLGKLLGPAKPTLVGKFPEEIEHNRLCGSPTLDSLTEAILEADCEKQVEVPVGEEDGAKVKEARARYMRFWRSITTNKQKPAPPCVLTEIGKLNGSGKTPRGALLFLFEDWLQSKEVWSSP